MSNHRAGCHYSGADPAINQSIEKEMSMGVIFITHDMGVVAELPIGYW